MRERLARSCENNFSTQRSPLVYRSPSGVISDLVKPRRARTLDIPPRAVRPVVRSSRYVAEITGRTACTVYATFLSFVETKQPFLLSLTPLLGTCAVQPKNKKINAWAYEPYSERMEIEEKKRVRELAGNLNCSQRTTSPPRDICVNTLGHPPKCF